MLFSLFLVANKDNLKLFTLRHERNAKHCFKMNLKKSETIQHKSFIAYIEQDFYYMFTDCSICVTFHVLVSRTFCWLTAI